MQQSKTGDDVSIEEISGGVDWSDEDDDDEQEPGEEFGNDGLAELMGNPLMAGGMNKDNAYSSFFESNRKSTSEESHVQTSEEDLLREESSQKVDINGSQRVLFIQASVLLGVSGVWWCHRDWLTAVLADGVLLDDVEEDHR